jgi:hypothetical protein
MPVTTATTVAPVTVPPTAVPGTINPTPTLGPSPDGLCRPKHAC